MGLALEGDVEFEGGSSRQFMADLDDVYVFLKSAGSSKAIRGYCVRSPEDV
jgi:hypothetical protein